VKRSTRNWILLVVTSVPAMWIGWKLTTLGDDHPTPPNAVSVKVQVNGARDRADLVKNDDGSYSYLIWRHGKSQKLSPEQLAERTYTQQTTGGILATVFNISKPSGLIWVGVGLIGQVLFTGRMVVQWIASEKNRKSVVPPMFWWMSLIGALMLLSYFLWRRDVVGVLGQSFGLFIYIRNLYLIHREHRNIPATVDPAPEPELG
jgi:lipid-A-disaccharide synthase-like uncharacterized protein